MRLKETDKPEVPGPGPSLRLFLFLFLISLLILVNIHPCLVHWDGKDPVGRLAGMDFSPAASDSRGTLVKFLTNFEPLFPLLYDEHNNGTHHTELL